LTGEHGNFVEAKHAILTVLSDLGMIVLFIATDGDTDLDREHVQYANMYIYAP
jgi:hypothetical protein